jgi:hypothetical protein
LRPIYSLAKLSIFLIFLSLAVQAYASHPSIHSTAKQISFRENKGQVRDQNFKPRKDVLFSGATGNFSFYLKNDGLHYQLNKIDSWKKSNQATVLENEEPKLIPDLVSIYRVDINWKGANKNATIEEGKVLEGYDNFYNVPEGMEPALFVKSYNSLTYKNIYNGIDLKFYESRNGDLEYDFLVQPNADYRQIALEIKGAEISVNDKQELIIKTPFGSIIEGALAIYQDEKRIAGKWIVEGQTVRFAVTGLYDQNKPLRIDPPVRVWGTYAGVKVFDNTCYELALSCSTDPTGNVFTAGQIYGGLGSTLTSNIVSTGAHQTTVSVNTAFLMKFDANGVRQWGTFYGTSGDDFGAACAADASGNVFLAGASGGTTGIATAGSHQPNKDISTDAYLVKFNAAGVRQWGTYFGKEYGEEATSVAVDNNGDVYMAGTGGPSVNFGTPGTHQQSGAGGTEAFLVKFNTNGTRLWCTMFGGPLQEETSGCNTDANGNVYLNGRTRSASGIASTGAAQTVYGGGDDMFIAKFNGNGVRQWSTYLGGPNDEGQYDGDAKPSVDVNGNVYICGTTYAPTGINSAISTPGAYQTTYGGGGSDAFLAKWNSTGALQWATYYGGTGLDYAFATSMDASGNIYFSGKSFSGTGIATPGVHQNTLNGTNDAILIKFLPNGQRDWGTYYGGSGVEERGWNLTVHKPSGAIYLCGEAFSTNNIATTGAHQSVFAGGYSDAFLAKFIDCPSAGSITITTNSPVCAGQNLNLSVPSFPGATYTWAGPNSFNLFASSIHNPTINNAGINASGMYAVTVTANGCPGSLGTVSVVVNAPPTVTASNNGPVCAGQAVNLSVSALPNATYTWSGPAGFSATTQNPTITSALAPNAGVYSVSVTSNGCVATATTNVTVNPIPSVVSGSNSPVCVGQTLQFNAGSQPGLTYAWTGPNGFSSSLQNPSIPNVTLADTGSYTLVLTAANGCTNNPNVKVNVINTPVAPTVSSTAICAGQTTNLNVTAPSGATFAWFTVATGGTAVFTGNPFVTPTLNSNTTYFVEAQSGSCVSSRTAVVVTVTPAPAAPNASTLTPGVCRDSVAVFQISSAGTTFNWYATATSTTVLGTGTTFTSPPLAASGSYFVERVENSCPSSRTQVFVQVISAPDPTPANTQICAGTSATINSNISNAFTVNWYNSPSTTTPIFTGTTLTTPALSSNTTYYAQTFVNGCPSARVPVTVTVVTPPAAPTVSGTSICSGQTATLNATLPSGVTFAWFTAATGGTAIFTGNSFTTPALNSNTTYFVESQIGTCNSPTRTSVDVVVNSSPIVNVSSNSPICEGSDLNLTVNATTNASYTWSGPNGFTSSQQNPSIIGVGVSCPEIACH